MSNNITTPKYGMSPLALGVGMVLGLGVALGVAFFAMKGGPFQEKSNQSVVQNHINSDPNAALYSSQNAGMVTQQPSQNAQASSEENAPETIGANTSVAPSTVAAATAVAVMAKPKATPKKADANTETKPESNATKTASKPKVVTPATAPTKASTSPAPNPAPTKPVITPTIQVPKADSTVSKAAPTSVKLANPNKIAVSSNTATAKPALASKPVTTTTVANKPKLTTPNKVAVQ